MRRDALAEVLSALTNCDRLSGDAARVGRVVLDGLSVRMRDVETGDEFAGVVPWTHGSPAEAVEALATAGLWPWDVGDERAPGWWCEGCEGTGLAAVDTARGRKVYRCGECDIAGHTADPPSHAALVAVASLGRPLLQRITHTLAREIACAAGCHDARVVWRVMEREALLRHHEVTAREGDGWGCVYVSSHEHERARRPQSFGGQHAWPNACPWPSLAQVDAAWPALRALAVGDGATPQPTGVHLVGLDASRIVLAVEAL